ncbi:hypothetical protein LTR85_005563 [Meristemomyces frigidus]|nr:hypothetical protein LTR85_005563 [Meristemomyces frigidus]
MDGFKFKGMATKPSETVSRKPAPVRGMQDLSIQAQSKSRQRSFSDEDSSTGGPLKRGKTAEHPMEDIAMESHVMPASSSSRAMQAVWEQAHMSRCLARLQDLELELAAARSIGEQHDLRCRIEKLQRLMGETG